MFSKVNTENWVEGCVYFIVFIVRVCVLVLSDSAKLLSKNSLSIYRPTQPCLRELIFSHPHLLLIKRLRFANLMWDGSERESYCLYFTFPWLSMRLNGFSNFYGSFRSPLPVLCLFLTDLQQLFLYILDTEPLLIICVASIFFQLRAPEEIRQGLKKIRW